MHNATDGIGILFCGDVMTGRGVDQVLPHPGSPILYERHIRDAREYIGLAETLNGPIGRPVDFTYLWGDALQEMLAPATDLRIINLETSITRSNKAWSGKDVHYRMHPANIGCLTAARIDCCCLANNHVLDWGYPGLTETLQTLDHAGITRTGAGQSLAEAAAPAVFHLPEKGRVLVFSFGSSTSGIPEAWGAARERPGVHLLPDLSEATARSVGSRIRDTKQPSDIAVVSVHWGGNWGYDVPGDQVRFAHRLIDEGVDIIHGHSSHHVKATEVYQGRLITYGCGDLLDDYEGISGYEEFRIDLRLMYLVRVEPGSGELVEARLVPMQLKQFQLHRAGAADANWVCNLLNGLGSPFGTGVELEPDNSLLLRWR